MTPTEQAPAISTGEDLLVALATLHERHPDWFTGDFASFQQSLGQKLLVNPDLRRVDDKIYQRFRKLTAGVEVR